MVRPACGHPDLADLGFQQEEEGFMPMRRSPCILPFTPPAPRTPADPPTSANLAGGRLSKRRTLTPGLSMTLSLNVDELARALLRLEQEEGGRQGVQMSGTESAGATLGRVVRGSRSMGIGDRRAGSEPGARIDRT